MTRRESSFVYPIPPPLRSVNMNQHQHQNMTNEATPATTSRMVSPVLSKPVLQKRRIVSNGSNCSNSSSRSTRSVCSTTSKSSCMFDGYDFNNSADDDDDDDEYNEPVVKDLAILINQERKRRRLYPLERSPQLDYIAAEHCRDMAQLGSVFHSVNTVIDLQTKLSSSKVGENIQRGDSMYQMHCMTMSNSKCTNRSNILSNQFTEFGSSIYIGEKDGKIYCCQLFRRIIY
jgi:uncharacterized protein YkwD